MGANRRSAPGRDPDFEDGLLAAVPAAAASHRPSLRCGTPSASARPPEPPHVAGRPGHGGRGVLPPRGSRSPVEALGRASIDPSPGRPSPAPVLPRTEVSPMPLRHSLAALAAVALVSPLLTAPPAVPGAPAIVG